MSTTIDEAHRTVALFKSITEGDSLDDRYVNVLKEHNYCGILVPTLAFGMKLDELKKHLLQPEKYAGLIFTSPRSVECVKEAVGENLPAEWLKKLHYCVGEATQLAAQTFFPSSQLICSENGNAEHLSTLIISEYSEKNLVLPLLFPCSTLRMDTLPNALKKHNVKFEAVESYETVPHPHLSESISMLAEKDPKYLVFFSPSGVKFSLSSLRMHNMLVGKKVLSIGKTTSNSLANEGVEVSQVCSKPTPESLVEALTFLNSYHN